MGIKLQTVKREGADVVFAIDVSKSMLTEDIAPNRLDKAKHLVSKIIDKLVGDRVGIIVYAAQAFPQLPITTDYDVARLFLNNLNTDMISSQGTAIAQAINLSKNYYDSEEQSNKILIIISDGEDHSQTDLSEVISKAVSSGRASIVIDGSTYTTKPVKVEVTSAVKKPNAPNNADEPSLGGTDLFVKAFVSKTSPYLNELITVSYKLYWSSKINISNLNNIVPPAYNNFWNRDIKIPEMSRDVEFYKGKQYNVVTLKKIVLYPQVTGKIKIEPLKTSLNIEVPTGRMDFFGRLITKSLEKTIQSNGIRLQVKSLPTSGRPTSFKGAVGNFDFDIKVDKITLKVGESFQAKVTVKGSGNLKLIKLPNISLPSSLEVFEPEHKENIKTNMQGNFGSVSDAYTIVPESRYAKTPSNVKDCYNRALENITAIDKQFT
ncbi:BatD protein [Elysia marginata]|uniref:BatD protein n=1 Tax=Elysia marginata TaxID=1093978 RepID=A0AAV4F276_9GAST|nr:BatD protein [Elysia marginata]